MGADEYFEGLKTINLDLLEIMGRRYVIEHCISAFRAKQEEKLYRVYVTDALCALCGSNGMRYWEMIQPKTDDSRQDEEIINGIKDKIRSLNDERN